MTKEQLKNRTKKFALDVFKFLMKLEKNKAVDVVSFQLFKSSSSVAANYRAVCRGKSTADFLNKLKIVDEEADESLFWLEFIQGLEIECDSNELNKMIKEADELVAIFSAAIKTIKEKNNIKN
jgi:four helix bundle protein